MTQKEQDLLDRLFIEPVENGRIAHGRFERQEHACGHYLLDMADVLKYDHPEWARYLAEYAVTNFWTESVEQRAARILAATSATVAIGA